MHSGGGLEFVSTLRNSDCHTILLQILCMSMYHANPFSVTSILPHHVNALAILPLSQIEFCPDQPNHVSLRSGFVKLSRQGSNRGFTKYIDEACIVGTYSSRFKFYCIIDLGQWTGKIKERAPVRSGLLVQA